MKLLVGGCSHSAGSEIIEPWHPRCPEQAWGQHLANHFNCTEYINIAGPGYSNQWICNKTIKFLENCNNISEWVVAIGWSSSCRLPVYDYDYNAVVHLCPGHRNLKVHSKPVQLAYPHLYGTMLPEKLAIELEHSRILGMQMLLTQLNIPYIFFDTINSNHQNMSSKLINQKNYFRYDQQDLLYWQFYKKHRWTGDERWENHAPPSYHAEWAQLVIDYIEENNLWNIK